MCGSIFADAAESTARAEPADGTSVRFLAELSDAYDLVLVAGFCEVSGLAKPYNSAVVVDHGRVLAVYRKTHLWDFEHELFTPGDVLPPVVATSVGAVAPLICYDLAFPEVLRSVALRGAQLIASPANWPDSDSPDTRPPEVSKAMAGAAINRVVVVVADRVGEERGRRWVGGSVICDHEGYRVAGPDFGVETVLVADVDLDATLDKRHQRAQPRLRRPPHRPLLSAVRLARAGAYRRGTLASPLRDDRRRGRAQRLPNALSDP